MKAIEIISFSKEDIVAFDYSQFNNEKSISDLLQGIRSLTGYRYFLEVFIRIPNGNPNNYTSHSDWEHLAPHKFSTKEKESLFVFITCLTNFLLVNNKEKMAFFRRRCRKMSAKD